MSEARKLLGRSAGFSVMTALSRVLGLIRDILLAIVFGVSRARQAIVEDRFADFYHDFKARTSTQGSADEHGNKPMSA